MRALVLAFLVLSTGSAGAHAMLKYSDPGAGAVLHEAPAGVTLDFSESLEAAFSAVAVTDSSGHDVTQSPATTNGTTMTVRLKPLAPGTYHVKWRALSVDTHRTEGSFRFSVGP